MRILKKLVLKWAKDQFLSKRMNIKINFIVHFCFFNLNSTKNLTVNPRSVIHHLKVTTGHNYPKQLYCGPGALGAYLGYAKFFEINLWWVIVSSWVKIHLVGRVWWHIPTKLQIDPTGNHGVIYPGCITQVRA